MITLFKDNFKVELDEIKSVNLDGRESISVLVKRYINPGYGIPWAFVNQYVCIYCREEDLAKAFFENLGYKEE